MNRREFVKNSFIVGAALSMGTLSGCQQGKHGEEQSAVGEQVIIPKRILGATGQELSIIGFGGILVDKEEQIKANDMVAKAVERGVNYFDVAPTYGNAEERLGPALEPYRKNSFLACKTTQRDKVNSRKELEQSLKNLRTDYFDLYQLHGLTNMEEVDTALGKGGAIETFQKAREEGKVKYLGFSAHSVKAALAAMDRFDFDTILFPINFVCWYQGNFGPQVVEKAKEKNMGILALKAMAFTRYKEEEERLFKKCWYKPVTDPELASLALRFTLSQPVTAAIPPGEAQFFWQALDIASKFEKITSVEMDEIKKRSEGVEPIFKHG